MSNLIERYVHEVGRYLPESERKEVQDELRSLIQDQLDDRAKGAPTEDDVVELLTELGEPRKMAASYGREQYLIGPALYPTMIRVLQRGWTLIPFLVVLINMLLAFVSGRETTLIGLLFDTLFLVIQVMLVFSAIVVGIFAIMERTGTDLETKQRAFDPRALPRVDDPAAVERGEVVTSIAFGLFGVLILTYFLLVGGLTLRFNLSDPGEVVPVPLGWLVVSIITAASEVLINAIALRRGRWSVGLLLVEGGLSLVGSVAAYFIFFQPIADYIYEQVPALAGLPFAENAAVIAAVLIGFLSLLDTVSKLGKILFSGGHDLPSITVGPDGNGQPGTSH